MRKLNHDAGAEFPGVVQQLQVSGASLFIAFVHIAAVGRIGVDHIETVFDQFRGRKIPAVSGIDADREEFASVLQPDFGGG